MAVGTLPVLCGCGCGQPTAIAKVTRRERNQKKGQAVRFIKGHVWQGRKRSLEDRKKISARKRGAEHHLWKGGRTYKNGYLMTYAPEHPYRTTRNLVAEHRLVVEQEIGRYLLASEKVHHKNGIRDDNRPENLEVLSPSNHRLRETFCWGCDLKKEIRLLRWEIEQLLEDRV